MFNRAEGHSGAPVEAYQGAIRDITVSCLQIGECNDLPNIDALVDDIVAEHGSGTRGFDFDIDELIRNGAPLGRRSEAFARVVWSLAGKGYTVDQIEEELRYHPN